MRPPRRIHWVVLDAQAPGFSRRTVISGQITVWPGCSPAALRGGLGVFHGVGLNLDLRHASEHCLDWVKALRPHVGRGSWLHCLGGLGESTRRQLSAAGWEVAPATPQLARFDPCWPVADLPADPQRRVGIIGAGLAGAAIAYTLSQRGWDIDWLDAGAGSASGASGLPVGLLSRHSTARPTPMSELADLAMPHTVAALHRLLPQGHGWQESWVDNLVSDRPGPPPGRERAWLIEPAALVRAWWQAACDSDRVRWLPRQRVTELKRDEGGWQCLDAQQRVICHTPQLIVANAFDARALLGAGVGDIRAVAGQMSWAPWPTEQSPCAPNPRRAHGVLTPSFHGQHGHIWAVGSTYRRGVTQASPSATDHDTNAQSLKRLCPQALQRFQDQRQNGQMQAFVAVRCASADRMPVIGAVPAADAPWPAHGGLAAVPRQAGLQVVTALGSRGLTLAAWAAHSLADQLEHVPLDTPAHLIRACDPGRKSLRRASPQSC